jgi:DNA-binding PadR family transcriptional regulator
MRINPLAMVALQLLHERAMHPYEIHQVIRDRYIDHVVKVRAGSLYHTVEMLHRSELIEPVETGRSGRRPERTVYAITDLGREEFHGSLRDLVRTPAPEFPAFGAAVEMLHMLDRQEVVALLTTRAIALEGQVAAYEQISAGLVKRGLPRSRIIEVEYARARDRAELDWVRQLIDDIDSGALPWPAPPAEEHSP